MESVEQLVASGDVSGGSPAGRRLQPDQGPRQGRPEDHVQDGHFHRGLLHRRPDLRSARPRPGTRGRVLLRHTPSSAASASMSSRPSSGTAPAWPTPKATIELPHKPCWAAANTSGAATANTCSTWRPSSGCSTPRVTPLRHLQVLHPRRGRPVREPRDPARAAEVQGRPASRCRLRKWSPSPASSSASPPAP